ncbi:MAG: hypothetical protein IJN08_01250 [Clostridia bacterium]|nr:hypothetical protein [Clostridia bacterium]
MRDRDNNMHIKIIKLFFIPGLYHTLAGGDTGKSRSGPKLYAFLKKEGQIRLFSYGKGESYSNKRYAEAVKCDKIDNVKL